MRRFLLSLLCAFGLGFSAAQADQIGLDAAIGSAPGMMAQRGPVWWQAVPPAASAGLCLLSAGPSPFLATWGACGGGGSSLAICPTANTDATDGEDLVWQASSAWWCQDSRVVGSNGSGVNPGNDALIIGGDAGTAAAGGSVRLTGGAGGSLDGDGGSIIGTAGAALGSALGNGGDISFTAGSSNVRNGGRVFITGGSVATSEPGGDVTISGGSSNGTAGSVLLNSSNSVIATAPGVTLDANVALGVVAIQGGEQVQISDEGVTGINIFGTGTISVPINLTAGNGAGAGTTAGAITAIGGSSADTGGAIDLEAGSGGVHGGNFTIDAGGPDGNITLQAGENLFSGPSGSIVLNAGDSTAGPNNGSITLRLAGGSGTAAHITLDTGVSTENNYVVIPFLPTSCTGSSGPAPTGALWNNSGLVSACPLGAHSNVAYLDANQSFTKAQRAAQGAAVDSSGTWTPNFDTFQHFNIQLVHAECPCTLANPSTTPVAGQTGVIQFIQSATGSDAVSTWGTDYIYSGGTATIALSTSASAKDALSYYVIDSTHILLTAASLNAFH